VNDVALDLAREARLGFPEIIYGQHKSPAQLERILGTYRELKKNLLITRVQPEKAWTLLTITRSARYDEEARTLSLIFEVPEALPGRVGVVCAGTSDMPVVREAEETLTFLGVNVESHNDVGVAGIQRLFGVLPRLAGCDVLICVAGFEGALASVLGGLVPQPIIAVPTSVGYGVAEGGHAALNAMLASCANGITVVNIDNGYGAALAAFRILKRMPA
jgi:NCAIR mutase (PurE)-related protein